ncbi:MAG: cytochrome-c peroxidase, partial [Bacteroidia bacterium]
MKTLVKSVFVFAFLTVVFEACKPDDTEPLLTQPTPYSLEVPNDFAPPEIPANNPMTVEGVALGRKLFYDPILSGDNTQSCGSCHNADFAFTDNKLQFSIGIDKKPGGRNSMAIINLAWDKEFFWDGRAKSLEEQALGPVENPVEMHELWPNAIMELMAHSDYPELFEKAFGTKIITKELSAKAIAQFERTMISSNSVFDINYFIPKKTLEAVKNPQNSQERGMKIFYEKGDCWHCHGTVGDYLFTDRAFHNNGLDSIFTDKGQEDVSKNPMDRGKFKTPTLRNVEFTAPYMHDGRFKTLEEVIEFYSSGVKKSATLDPNMKDLAKGLNLTTQEKQDLKQF